MSSCSLPKNTHTELGANLSKIKVWWAAWSIYESTGHLHASVQSVTQWLTQAEWKNKLRVPFSPTPILSHVLRGVTTPTARRVSHAAKFHRPRPPRDTWEQLQQLGLSFTATITTTFISITSCHCVKAPVVFLGKNLRARVEENRVYSTQLFILSYASVD